MLDAFIIEELRRREEAERSHVDRPRLELPLEESQRRAPVRREEPNTNPAPDRGVIIIDY